MSEAGLFISDQLPADSVSVDEFPSVFCIRAMNIPHNCIPHLVTGSGLDVFLPPPGTTAHVGISLQGSESRSGHRHLDSVGAFTRNSLDIFHIASDTGLGSVLKIRVWHDNKGTDRIGHEHHEQCGAGQISQDKPVCVSLSGLSPAWLLQYVLVKDLQTGSRYFFLVEEWLSVDNEKTDGRVEIEVEASGKAPPPQR